MRRAASGSDEDEDEDDEYDQEYDDEYGDYGDEAAEDTVGDEVDGVNASTGPGPAPQENSNSSTVFAQSKTTQKQQNDDKLLGSRYPKFAEAVKVLDQIREKYPQFDLDGERNIWIMKPAGSSRGRGICLKRDLSEMLDMIGYRPGQQAISN